MPTSVSLVLGGGGPRIGAIRALEELADPPPA
jgi:hypothetical protein